jgi:hypothetical protein
MLLVGVKGADDEVEGKAWGKGWVLDTPCKCSCA